MKGSLAIGEPLLVRDVIAVAVHGQEVHLSEETVERMDAAREIVVRRLDDNEPHYGINTGFGALAEVPVSMEDIAMLQVNLVRSHATGLGEPLPREIVRATMLLRACVLASGHSGVRSEVAALLVNMLNAGIHPVMPSRGSVGASGDLAPLAHMALALICEGDVELDGSNMGACKAFEQVGLTPITLEAKEGLALVNGTQVMTAVGCIALWEARHLSLAADIIGAMTLEAVKGTPDAFDERIMAARPHPGQLASAKLLRNVLAGSGIREFHRDCSKVQDPYSLRCMPQVHGAVRDSLAHVNRVIEVETNSATDNPLVFQDGFILSGGNFHGEPIAIVLDLMAIAVAELASISERRIEHVLNPTLSGGLTPFLATRSGLCSGYMITQVTAASLVSENKVLAHPASVDSIPSSANREDHVSMGMTAGLKAINVIRNTRKVLAIEALCAAEGLDQRLPTRPGKGVDAVRELIRQKVTGLDGDRSPVGDIEEIDGMIEPGGGLVEAAMDVVGMLSEGGAD